MALYLSGVPEADQFLEADAFALLVGMVLDQQIPLERAFLSPYDLRNRLGGTLDVREVAAMDPEKLRAAFAERPALHRFPGSMADRVQQMARIVIDQYDGDAASVWTGASDGADLLKRVRALPGFGEQKAKIFVALLGKRLGVRPRGWDKAAGNFGRAGSFFSIADIDSAGALERVREHKREMKAAIKGQAPVEGLTPPAPKSTAGAAKKGAPTARATKTAAKPTPKGR